MIHISILIILIIINSYLCSVKNALLSVNIGKFKTLAENGDEKYIIFNIYLEKISKVLLSIRLLIIFFYILIGSLSVLYFTMPLSTKISRIIVFPINYYISIFIILLITTFFVFIFNDLIPCQIGIKYSDNLSYSSMSLIKFIKILLTPFTFISNFISNLIIKLMGINPQELDGHITEEEIRMMVDVGGNSGSIDETEKEMINNIFEFDNKSAGYIATHRKDIFAIPLNSSIDDIIDAITSKKYSRIPVYNENIDDIVGILHIKDVIKYIIDIKNLSNINNFNIQHILMKPYFVPFSKKIDELFDDMRKKKVHMSIVIDEYGGTAGIVTMEDLLEEIVGNIFDEYDIDEDEDIKILNENSFLIKGSANLEDIEEFLNTSFDKDDNYDTLSGFIISLIGRIPHKNEMLSITHKGFLFKILSINDNRIQTIKVTKEKDLSL